MSYAFWTNLELRRLEKMHVNHRPTLDILAAAIPKHPPASILHMARKLGLRSKRSRNYKDEPRLRRLKIAHEYFARREAGLLV